MTNDAEAAPSEPELRYRGRLDLSPEIAVAIGAYVAEFATLEAVLEILFDAVVQAPVPQNEHRDFGHAVLGHLQSFSLRCDVLASVLEVSQPAGTDHGDRIANFIAEARKINARRNIYVHGTYTYEPAQQRVLLHSWATSKGKKKSIETLSVQQIDKDIAAIRSVLGTLIPNEPTTPPPEQPPSP